MEILVCIKQVPGSNKVEVDSVTGVLKRSGADAKMNPYDLFALEAGLRLREKFGGSVRRLFFTKLLLWARTEAHSSPTENLAARTFSPRATHFHKAFANSASSTS